ncbi:TPA: zonular occludens toxin family protein [Salmonella enterica subsp. enterica]
MAITGYIGLPGSGKSFECVSNVLLPAVKAGRRVITNIIGVNPDVIYDYCVDTLNLDRASLGVVVVVDSKTMKQRDFFPYKNSNDETVTDTFCQPGDLIMADEAWRLWPKDSDICHEHRSFFAEHRHFTNSLDGTSCDFVYMTQSLATVARYIRDRQDKTFRMKKLTSLGLSTRYRVDVFEGAKTTKAALIQQYQCSYKKEIFPLYKSYDMENGQETVVDKRQSFLNGRFFFRYLFFPLALLTVGIYFLFNLYQKYMTTSEDKTETEQVSAAVPAPVNADNAFPVAGMTENFTASAAMARSSVSSTWRIGGRMVKGDLSYVVLVNVDGRVRMELLNGFSFNGLYMSGFVDGEKVTVWSGSLSGAGTGLLK